MKKKKTKKRSIRRLYLYAFDGTKLNSFIFCHGRVCPSDVIQKGAKKNSDNLVYQFGSTNLSIHQKLSQMVFLKDLRYLDASATIFDGNQLQKVVCFLN